MVRRAARRGLTVLEITVAIALATMVVLILAVAFQLVVGRYADETGQRFEGDRAERVRAIMTTQLSWLELGVDSRPRRFSGASGALEFRTMVGLDHPHLRRPTAARFVVEPVSDSPPTQRLVYRERGMRPEDLAYEDRTGEVAGVSGARAGVVSDALRESSQGQVLLSGAKSIRFEYLRLSGSEATWLSSWSDDYSPPRAVRVTFEDHSGEIRRWVLPVLATF